MTVRIHLRRRLRSTFVVAALAATALVGLSAGTASAAACGSYLHPSVNGGEAEWTVACDSSRAWGTDGAVWDTRRDGKCASVRFVWPDGTIWYSPRACGYGHGVGFVTPRNNGKSVNGYLIVT